MPAAEWGCQHSFMIPSRTVECPGTHLIPGADVPTKQCCHLCFEQKSRSAKVSLLVAGWPGWVNFRLLGNCLLGAVVLKIIEVAQTIGIRFSTVTVICTYMIFDKLLTGFDFGLFLYKLIWGRCYDHNFLRFLSIFCEDFGVFLKHQCYYPIYCKN
jgi:hypothetical protein